MAQPPELAAGRSAFWALTLISVLAFVLPACAGSGAAPDRTYSGAVEVSFAKCGASPVVGIQGAEVRLVFKDGASKLLGYTDEFGLAKYNLPESEVERAQMFLVCHRDCCFCGALTGAARRIKEGPKPYIFLAPIVVY